MKFEKLNNVSSAAVEKATGKNWDKWITIIDKFGGDKMTHKEIARNLNEKYLDNGWWCQGITVGYEYAKGRRTKGETAEAGFEIGVQKTINHDPRKVWNFMISRKGMDIWLGKSAKPVSLIPGSKFKILDAIEGEIRTITPGKKVRMSFANNRKGRGGMSTLQFYVMPGGKYLNKEKEIEEASKTSLRFHHERLKSSTEREKMRKYWQNKLNEIVNTIGK